MRLSKPAANMSFLTKEFLAPGRSRPALDRALGQLRPGDVLVTWRLDRLGRSLSHLIHVVAAPPVHPRVCGEHLAFAIGGVLPLGSSPRVRGTRRRFRPRPATRLFIPACAGNTASRSHVQGDSAVHPRVCGEHFVAIDQLAPQNGSSPRVRGTQVWGMRPGCVERFIPACAGNTRARAALREAWSVHPRVCGEH